MQGFLKLKGREKEAFNQSKYEYYKKFNLLTLLAASIGFVILFAVDFDAFQYLAWDSLMRRILVLALVAVVALAYFKTDNYKIMCTLSFIAVHAMIWDSIWVTSYPALIAHANEGFLFMGFVLMMVSFGAPLRYSFIAQWGLVWDLILANSTFHYADFSLMVAYNCQVVVMLNIVSFIVTKLYFDHYTDNEKLQFILLHDPLTQVFNRNKLDDKIGMGSDLSAISKNICILVLDIDHFKKVNDTYGHDKGDEILKFIATSLKDYFRKEDIIIRWGGEEFVVILPECELKQGFDIAERTRKAIEVSDNGICKVTVSIGIAEYLGGDCIDTINNADLALYEAKNEGRNVVKIL
ncbi:GGDEF domain-containing protein [Eubacteriaceae bacterium ES2]|nr:GGDEF domain-containing protein [Eubacteriaceae bacterium ES2]